MSGMGASLAARARRVASVGRPRANISIVPCGVDVDQFTPNGPHATRGSRPRVVSVGRLVPRKGFAGLIAALPAVPNAELVIVGGPAEGRLEDDPEACRLRAQAHQLGVLDR